jgi:hypothetical protein
MSKEAPKENEEQEEKFPLELGINKDISNDHYHSNKTFFSSSVLKDLLKDKELFHKKYILKEEVERSGPLNAFLFGSYVHTLILEPHLVDVELKFALTTLI